MYAPPASRPRRWPTYARRPGQGPAEAPGMPSSSISTRPRASIIRSVLRWARTRSSWQFLTDRARPLATQDALDRSALFVGRPGEPERGEGVDAVETARRMPRACASASTVYRADPGFAAVYQLGRSSNRARGDLETLATLAACVDEAPRRHALPDGARLPPRWPAASATSSRPTGSACASTIPPRTYPYRMLADAAYAQGPAPRDRLYRPAARTRAPRPPDVRAPVRGSKTATSSRRCAGDFEDALRAAEEVGAAAVADQTAVDAR